MAIDYTSDAALLALVRAAYYNLLAGQMTQTVDWPGPNGTTRRVTYAQTDLSKLEAEFRRLDAKVNPGPSNKPKRFALRAG